MKWQSKYFYWVKNYNYLSPSFGGMVWDHYVRPDLNLVPVDDERAPGLHGQLARARRPRAEAHNLDVTGVRWLEFYYVVSFVKFFLVYHAVELNSFISRNLITVLKSLKKIFYSKYHIFF